MYKVVIPEYNHRVAPLFDVAGTIHVFNLDRGTVYDEGIHSLLEQSMHSRIDKLRNWDTDIVICSAISRIYCDSLLGFGIDFITGVIGDVCDVIQAYVAGTLVEETFVMPGCRGRGRKGMRRCMRYSDLMRDFNRREVQSMKIAITSKGPELGSDIDPRFGRARGFIVYDLETNEFFYKDNEQNLNAAQGAGIQAAQQVINEGVQALISGNVGPKAFATLNAAGVDMYLHDKGTVSEALGKYHGGELVKLDTANVEGHW